MRGIFLTFAFAALATAPLVAAQSNAASQVSALSFAPSAEAFEISTQALEAGSALTVTALRPVGEAIEVSLAASAEGASAVIRLAAASVQAAGIAVGSAVSVIVVSAGYLLVAGSEVLAFIPNELARHLTYHHEL